MAERNFPVTGQQWEQFVKTISPALGELLAAGLLNEAADEVRFLGGRADVDLRCQVDAVEFSVEVKTAWWHDDEQLKIGHSPLRQAQDPDLVALFGSFESGGDDRTVRRIAEDGLEVNDDRFFYLLPCRLVRQHSSPDGKSQGRALILEEVVRPFVVDLGAGLDRQALLSLLAPGA